MANDLSSSCWERNLINWEYKVIKLHNKNGYVNGWIKYIFCSLYSYINLVLTTEKYNKLDFSTVRKYHISEDFFCQNLNFYYLINEKKDICVIKASRELWNSCVYIPSLKTLKIEIFKDYKNLSVNKELKDYVKNYDDWKVGYNDFLELSPKEVEKIADEFYFTRKNGLVLLKERESNGW